MPVSGIRGVEMRRPGMLSRMNLHLGNFVRGVGLGLKFMAPPAAMGAAAIFAAGCDTAKVECESTPVTINSDAVFTQITQRMSEGKITFETTVPIQISNLEMDRSPVVSVTLGTENARIISNGSKEMEFVGSLEQAAGEPCPAAGPIVNCSPFAGEAYDGAIAPVGVQKTFEGSRLYEDVKADSETPGMWAGIGPIVDRVWGSKVYLASDLFTVFHNKIDMSSGEPVEKSVYLETDREGYVLDADGNRLTTEEEALANGRDISELVDPSIQAGQPNAGMDPQTPDALGLEQNTGYFAFNRAEEKWDNLDDNGLPIPDFSLGGSGHTWTPVMDPSKLLGDIYENMIAEGVDPTVYAIPLRVKAKIRDLRDGSEIGEIDLGEMALEDFLRNPISFQLPEELMAESINAAVTLVAEADPTSFETALVYTAYARAMVKLDMQGTCEAPADGGSE